MFAEDMIATGRTTAGFSHNRPFLPNDNPDETRVRPPHHHHHIFHHLLYHLHLHLFHRHHQQRSVFENTRAKLSVAEQDDISEEMSSSFLDITTTTTEASTLERVREMIIFILFACCAHPIPLCGHQEEDGTELSTIDSDFEDEEEL
jgi:hypothetical protein